METLKEILGEKTIIVFITLLITGVFYLLLKGASFHIGKDGININNKLKNKAGNNSSISFLEAIIAIINYQTTSQQEEYSQVEDIIKSSLVNQLDYVDTKFLAYKSDCEKMFIKNDGVATNDEMLSIMMFDKYYEEFRRTIVDIIKKNHLAEKTELQIQEQVELKSKAHINSIKDHFNSFPTDIDRENFLLNYEKIIKKITIEAITYARNISIKREQKLVSLRETFKQERNSYVCRYLLSAGVSEKEVRRLISNTTL